MKMKFTPCRWDLPVILALAVPLSAALLAIPLLSSLRSDAPPVSGTSADSSSSFSSSSPSGLFPGGPSGFDGSAAVSGAARSCCPDPYDPSGSSGSSPTPAAMTPGIYSSTDESTGVHGIIDIEPAPDRATVARTSAFFAAAIPDLQASLSGSTRYAGTILLDEITRTSAHILAENANCASNLNGYFYYLIDETASTDVLSPAVLCLSILFDEDHRAACIADGTFAQKDLLDLFKRSLKAVLGSRYSDRIFDFLYGRYRDMFAKKYRGESVPAEAVRLTLPGIEIIYRDSFMTYAEFYITE